MIRQACRKSYNSLSVVFSWSKKFANLCQTIFRYVKMEEIYFTIFLSWCLKSAKFTTHYPITYCKFLSYFTTSYQIRNLTVTIFTSTSLNKYKRFKILPWSQKFCKLLPQFCFSLKNIFILFTSAKMCS